MTKDVHLRVSSLHASTDCFIFRLDISKKMFVGSSILTKQAQLNCFSLAFSAVMNIAPGREWPGSVDYFLVVTHNLCSLPIELLKK